MTQALSDVLRDFERALAVPQPSYAALIGGFRALKVEGRVSDTDLRRVYALCFRVLGLAEDTIGPGADLSGMAGWQADHLRACASDQINRTLYDRNADGRHSLETTMATARPELKAELEGIYAEYPKMLRIPWSENDATAQLRPYLAALENQLRQEPLAHLDLCSKVARCGHPVFRVVISDWLDHLEAAGIGMSGTADAIARAQAVLRPDLSEAEARAMGAQMLDLLDHPHPMVAASAAKVLGLLTPKEGLELGPGLPLLDQLLIRLAAHPVWPRSLSGGFLDVPDMNGLAQLAGNAALTAAGFDLKTWVLRVLDAQGGPLDDIHLPEGLTFWFHLHEYFCFDVAFIETMLKRGHAWIAMMCATEMREEVAGMRPVLMRLARHPDPEVAEAARGHLARHYPGPT